MARGGRPNRFASTEPSDVHMSLVSNHRKDDHGPLVVYQTGLPAQSLRKFTGACYRTTAKLTMGPRWSTKQICQHRAFGSPHEPRIEPPQRRPWALGGRPNRVASTEPPEVHMTRGSNHRKVDHGPWWSASTEPPEVHMSLVSNPRKVDHGPSVVDQTVVDQARLPAQSHRRST